VPLLSSFKVPSWERRELWCGRIGYVALLFNQRANVYAWKVSAG